MLDKRATKRVFGRIGLGLFALMAIQTVVVAVVSALGTTLFEGLMQSDWFALAISYGAMYLIGFPVLLAIYKTIPNGQAPDFAPVRMPVGRILALALACLGLTYPLNYLSALINQVFAQLKGDEVVNPLEALIHGGNTWFTLIIAVFVAPVLEEIIFRGLLYKKLVGYGGKVYVLFSALVFALFHGNLSQMLYAFVLGMVFAGITYYTKTVRYSIILHIVINFIGTGVPLLLLAYGDEHALILWSSILMLVVVAGIVVGIVLLVRHRKQIVFAPAAVQIERKSAMFLNLGMILFCALMALFVVMTLLM